MGVSQSHNAIVKLQTSLHVWSLVNGFRLLKRNLHFPFEQCSFIPRLVGLCRGWKTTHIYSENYNRQLWESLLPNQYFMTCQWWVLITAHLLSVFFRQGSDEFPPLLLSEQKNPPPFHRVPRWFHWQEWPWRIYVTWSWKKCTESRPVVWWMVFGPGFHVVLGCPVGSS